MGDTNRLLTALSNLNATSLVSALYNDDGKLSDGDRATINFAMLLRLRNHMSPEKAKNTAKQITDEITDAIANGKVEVHNDGRLLAKREFMGPKRLEDYTAPLDSKTEWIPVSDDEKYIIENESSVTAIQLHKGDVRLHDKDGRLLAAVFNSKGSIQTSGDRELRSVEANSTVSFNNGKPTTIVRKQ